MYGISAAVAGLTAAGALFAIGATQSTIEPPPEPVPAAARTVRTQVVRDDAAAAEQTFTGIVKARYESDLAFRVGGKVLARLIDVGATVRAGQPIARLDPADYSLAVKAAAFPPLQTWLIARRFTRPDLTPEADAFRKLLLGTTG